MESQVEGKEHIFVECSGGSCGKDGALGIIKEKERDMIISAAPLGRGHGSQRRLQFDSFPPYSPDKAMVGSSKILKGTSSNETFEHSFIIPSAKKIGEHSPMKMINSPMKLDSVSPKKLKNFSPLKLERNPMVLARRERQLSYGRNTSSYDKYLDLVDKKSRDRTMPRTPQKNRVYSRRQWDGLVDKWKKDVHHTVANLGGRRAKRCQSQESDKEMVDLGTSWNSSVVSTETSNWADEMEEVFRQRESPVCGSAWSSSMSLKCPGHHSLGPFQSPLSTSPDLGDMHLTTKGNTNYYTDGGKF